MGTLSYLGEGERTWWREDREDKNNLEEKTGYLGVGLVFAHFEVLSEVLVLPCLVNLRLKLEEHG